MFSFVSFYILKIVCMILSDCLSVCVSVYRFIYLCDVKAITKNADHFVTLVFVAFSPTLFGSLPTPTPEGEKPKM